jgi:hypothetical protein
MLENGILYETVCHESSGYSLEMAKLMTTANDKKNIPISLPTSQLASQLLKFPLLVK